MSAGTMLWSTRVKLDCGCTTRIEQVGYATPIPAPGEAWTCQTHGATEVRQSWRVGR